MAPPLELTQRLRVLCFGRFSDNLFGGLERHVFGLIESLQGQVDFVNLVENRRWALKEDYSAGCRTIHAPAIATIASTPICPTMPWWARRLHHQYRFHIAHLHLPDPMSHLAAMALPREVKLVLTWHSDIIRQKALLRFYSPFLRSLIRRADAVIAPTPAHFTSSPLLSALNLTEKYHTVPFGFNLEKYSRPDARANDIRKRYSGKLIFALGRHVYYKGFEYLIDAMRSIDDARVLLGGDGPLTEELRARAEAMGVQQRVLFLGRIPDDELTAYYQACDVFCLPSIERSEAFAIVQVEAMAAGKPVICCELGNGVNYVNRNNVTGITVAPRDAAALASALRTLLNDSDLRSTMGAAARERVFSEFTMQNMRDRTLEVYRSILRAP